MPALHLTTPTELAQAHAAGEYRVSSRGATLDDVGFIHLCTRAQLPGVVSRFYPDVPGLIALVVDLQACESAGSPVRWEPASDAAGELFPHVYGPLPWSSILAELPVRRDGSHIELGRSEQDWPDL
ncbi:MAG: DUF952 domain-containing protein [Micrococcales bacterium]|nr:DUF952 domain-containing protein [Micrococcales bacterium]